MDTTSTASQPSHVAQNEHPCIECGGDGPFYRSPKGHLWSRCTACVAEKNRPKRRRAAAKAAKVEEAPAPPSLMIAEDDERMMDMSLVERIASRLMLPIQHEHLTKIEGRRLVRKAILALQDGRCAACACRIQENPTLDHDHATGRVRGVLCMRCNTMAGFLETLPEIVAMIQKYLDGKPEIFYAHLPVGTLHELRVEKHRSF